MSACANWAKGVTRKKKRNKQRLMVSGLCRLHFPTRPNLSHRTESCQIKADSYHSVSSPQTRQLRSAGDYADGERDSPIWRLLGIGEALSDLSDLLWCLPAHSSTNTSADACRSLVGIETQESSCSASAANAKQRGPGWPAPLARFIYVF